MKKVGGCPFPPIRPGDVHFWLFDLNAMPVAYPAWEQLLSTEEITRSKRFIFDKDRIRFIARRGILRQLLSRYIGFNPAEISYSVNPHGKLTLPSQPISFNLSTSENRIAYVFTLEKDAGVDIEQIHHLPDLAQLAKSWFSQEEQTGLFTLPSVLQMEAFFHVWTQKEAFIKACGEGLSYPLADFSVSVDPNKPGKLLSFIKKNREQISDWQIMTIVPEAGWRAAICVRAMVEPEILWIQPKVNNSFFEFLLDT